MGYLNDDQVRVVREYLRQNFPESQIGRLSDPRSDFDVFTIDCGAKGYHMLHVRKELGDDPKYDGSWIDNALHSTRRGPAVADRLKAAGEEPVEFPYAEELYG